MKLTQWSKQQGITYRTAWQWFKDGKLPVPAFKTPSGSILVKQSSVENDKAATLYVHVSSSDQKKDLDRQISRLVQFAQQEGLVVSGVVSEVGSGMNGRRAKLIQLLKDKDKRIIVVEHKDRLMRYGYEYLESALASQGRKLLVADPTELKDDLVQDMIEVLTSFCARLYGRRSAKNRVKKAVAVIQESESHAEAFQPQ
jgi:putative resolvase